MRRSIAPKGEESPDSIEHLPVESTDGRKFMDGVTENNRRLRIRSVAGKGENVRQELTTAYGDMRGVRTEGLQGQIYR